MKNNFAFSQASNWGMKSDIFRYEILMKYGGVYIDTDYECLINIGRRKNIKYLSSHIEFFFYHFVMDNKSILKFLKTLEQSI